MDPNSGLGSGGSERTLGADSASIVGNFIPPRGYALSGKIMLSAIIVLFAVVLLLFALHLYIRWYVHRLALRRRRRRLTRRPLIFSSDVRSLVSHGLDPKTLESIPVISYRTEGYDGEQVAVECAVCLCEFEEGERLRRLPLCDHFFHVECIDMWFHSHETCPLCRAAVEAVADEPADAFEVSVPAITRSNSCPLCGRAEYRTGSSSVAAVSGVGEVRINVHSGGEEEGKSTGGAIGALRRMLSMEMSVPPEEAAEAEAAAAEPPV